MVTHQKASGFESDKESRGWLRRESLGRGKHGRADERHPHKIAKNLTITANRPELFSARVSAFGGIGGAYMFVDQLEDHGLPLVQLKERRRDMIVALMGRTGPITKGQIAEIAGIQQAIAAAEAVVVDIDVEPAMDSHCHLALVS